MYMKPLCRKLIAAALFLAMLLSLAGRVRNCRAFRGAHAGADPL